MSEYVGFEAAEIAILKDGVVDGEIYKIVGDESKGATVSASISGLSSEAADAYGSNVKYYSAQKGVGNVSGELVFIDMPKELEDKLLGHKTVAGFKAIGKDSEPPYCAVKLVTEDLRGNQCAIGIFKCKFSSEEINLKTKEEGNSAPEGKTYKISIVASDAKETKGVSVLEDVLEESQVLEFDKLIFPKATPKK